MIKQSIGMKAKLLINDSNFQRTNRQSPFIIKTKQSQSKLRLFAAASRTIPFQSKPKQPTKSIQQCLQELQISIIQERPLCKETCSSIRKFLFLLKEKYSSFEEGSLSKRFTQQDGEGSISFNLERKYVSYVSGQRDQFKNEEKQKQNISESSSAYLKPIKMGNFVCIQNTSESSFLKQDQTIKQLQRDLEKIQDDIEGKSKQIQRLQEAVDIELKKQVQYIALIKELQLSKVRAQERLKLFRNQKDGQMEQMLKKMDVLQVELKNREKELIGIWQALSFPGKKDAN